MDSRRQGDLPGSPPTRGQVWFELITTLWWVPLLVIVVAVLAIKTLF